MTVRVLTALYDDKGPAESARDDLVALGLPGGDIAIHAAATPSGTASAVEDQTLWNELGEMRLPEADRHVYAEAVRRGGHLLVARMREDQAARAADMLERLDPVDLDERAEMWRLAGWQGYAPGVGLVGSTEPTPEEGPEEPALAHAPLPEAEDPVRVGGLGESIAYAAEPAGHGRVRRRVRRYRVPPPVM